jgi:predicted transcriptional regulator
MGDLSDFQTGQMVGACLTGASVPKMSTLLGVSRPAVSKVMTSYTNCRKTSSSKMNNGQKTKVSERDLCTLKKIVSESHRTTAAMVAAEFIIHCEDPVSTKTVG